MDDYEMDVSQINIEATPVTSEMMDSINTSFTGESTPVNCPSINESNFGSTLISLQPLQENFDYNTLLDEYSNPNTPEKQFSLSLNHTMEIQTFPSTSTTGRLEVTNFDGMESDEVTENDTTRTKGPPDARVESHAIENEVLNDALNKNMELGLSDEDRDQYLLNLGLCKQNLEKFKSFGDFYTNSK